MAHLGSSFPGLAGEGVRSGPPLGRQPLHALHVILGGCSAPTGLSGAPILHCWRNTAQTTVSLPQNKSTVIVKTLILRRIIRLHVLAIKYCCSTLCQNIGLDKFALELVLLRYTGRHAYQR
jgi:hypothetical protein